MAAGNCININSVIMNFKYGTTTDSIKNQGADVLQKKNLIMIHHHWKLSRMIAEIE